MMMKKTSIFAWLILATAAALPASAQVYDLDDDPTTSFEGDLPSYGDDPAPPPDEADDDAVWEIHESGQRCGVVDSSTNHNQITKVCVIAIDEGDFAGCLDVEETTYTFNGTDMSESYRHYIRC